MVCIECWFEGGGGWKQLIEKCVPDIISLCKFSDARLTSNYISVWLRWFWGELTRFSDLLVQLWGASHPINQAEHCKHHPFSSYNHRFKKHTHHQVYPSPVEGVEVHILMNSMTSIIIVSISLPIHCQSQSFTVLCARQRLISICSKIGVIWAHSLVTPVYQTILFKVFFLINWEGKHFRKNHFAHPAIEILNVRCYL